MPKIHEFSPEKPSDVTQNRISNDTEKIPNIERQLHGESIIKPEGIYTLAHFYKHPKTGKEVYIIGTDHSGDKEYYNQIAEILQKCDVVIYEESIHGQKRTEPAKQVATKRGREWREEILKKLNSNDIDNAFDAAMREYFFAAYEYLEMAREDD